MSPFFESYYVLCVSTIFDIRIEIKNQYEVWKWSWNDPTFLVAIPAWKSLNVTSFDRNAGVIQATISSVYRPALFLNAKILKTNPPTVDIVIDPAAGIDADTKSLIDAIFASIKAKTELCSKKHSTLGYKHLSQAPAQRSKSRNKADTRQSQK